MTFEDTFVVAAPVQTVWRFLRDPEQIGKCIPGTERVEMVDDRHYNVAASAKVSFLTVSFDMKVTVTEIDEPRRLVSVAEGVDSRLGERVKMTTALMLAPEGADTTRVGYRIDMSMFGKLASIGFAVIRGKAKQMAETFTKEIKARLETAA
jgi:carbon monoxide dehydrogenase subunit G